MPATTLKSRCRTARTARASVTAGTWGALTAQARLTNGPGYYKVAGAAAASSRFNQSRRPAPPRTRALQLHRFTGGAIAAGLACVSRARSRLLGDALMGGPSRGSHGGYQKSDRPKPFYPARAPPICD